MATKRIRIGVHLHADMRAYHDMTTVSTKKPYSDHSYDTPVTRQQHYGEMNRQHAAKGCAEHLFGGL